MPRRSRTSDRRARVRVTERDYQLLSFAAEHRLLLASHISVLLDTSLAAAEARLRALASDAFLAHQSVFHRQPACWQIRRKGLDAVGSKLPLPRLNLAGYKHDVGAAWLWLAAQSGTFGPVGEVLGERRMRSHDGARDWHEEPCGVRLGGLGPRGRERLHYPDLVLVAPGGQRTAFELELTPKGSARRQQILAGYGVDRRIDAVLYLVENRVNGRAIGRAIEASARSLGLSELVHVQCVRPFLSIPGESRSSATTLGRRSPGRRKRSVKRSPGAEATR